MSLFRCPLCEAPLQREERAYRCPTGHSFDIAAEGHTHLLPVNRKNSKMPGDDKGMAAARSAFLNEGYYAPLRDALCRLSLTLSKCILLRHIIGKRAQITNNFSIPRHFQLQKYCFFSLQP